MELKWLLLTCWSILCILFITSLFTTRMSKKTTKILGISVVVGFMTILLLIDDLGDRTQNANWNSYFGWLFPENNAKGEEK